MSRTEDLYSALIEGETIDITPRSRKEQFLKNCCEKCGCEGLPTPRSREEALLYKLAEQLEQSGGTVEPLEVTANGTYTPPEGVDGYAPVSVAVYNAEVPKITNARYLFSNEARHDYMDEFVSLISPTCTNFSSMFYQSNSLTSVPDLDTSNGTDFHSMFSSCRSLTSVPDLDTSNGTVFGYMFSNCTSLRTVPQFDTSKGTDFDHMFYQCGSLTSVPDLDTSNGTDFGSMFFRCDSLTTVPQFDTSKGTDFAYMFQECRELTTIPRLDIGKGSDVSSMFLYCRKLTNLTLYNIRKSLSIGSGTGWGSLLTVDSLVHTIKELCTVTTTQTLTMGSANLEKISGLYCRITDDNEKLTMELCESTDEGAMTLADYATLKGWQFK